MYPDQSKRSSNTLFSWDILRFILKGDSPIDLSALAISNREEAQDFLRHYGYNLDDSNDLSIVRDIFAESLGFIKNYFCDGVRHFPEPITIPIEFERLNDMCDLLVLASSNDDRERQLWACAILRVMHTIHHINHEVRIDFFPEIKRQVLDNFKRNISQDEQENPILGHGDLAVTLRHVFFKEEKERDSVILKLLQKAKNVAEKIHDRLGVKIVTSTKLDALRALNYLIRQNIIMFANITPGRSRNNLINLGYYHRLYDGAVANLENASTEEIERAFFNVAQILEGSEDPAIDDIEGSCFSGGTGNTFSSKDYCSLQFTVKQQVKLENPGFFAARRLRVQLERYHLGPDLEGLLNELEGPTATRERRILFPLEVQIIDYDNYIKTIEGNASHADYKKRQIQAAYLRVLGPLYKYLHPSIYEDYQN